MKIVFFGSSRYSLIGAEIINKKFGLSCIVTVPESPLQSFAINQKIPFIITKKLDKEIIKKIASLKPDFLVVEDYGLFLPAELLALPKYDSLNIHHSLLPKYRGPSPAPSAILAGEKVSGASIIHMTDKVDAGDIYVQKEYTLTSNETTDSLLKTLNLLGAKLLLKVISNYIKGQTKLSPQDDSKATFTQHLTKESGFINISFQAPLINLDNPQSLELLDRMIRAYHPWPGVWFKTKLGEQNRIVKLLPGRKIQVEGKKPMTYKDFANGYKEGTEILSVLGLKPEL